MPGPEPRLHLPYRRWPADDQLRWERALASDDPFADAAGARLAKATQHNYLFAYRRFLGFLAINEPEALEVAPHERLTIERVRSFVTHLAETNSPRSVANQIHMLYLAARMMMPECDWTWLKAVKTRLFAVAPAAANGPVITSLQLLDLGEQLMNESRPVSDTPISMDDAIRYRDGMMIAFVAFIPALRRKNLAALEIGRHLVRDGDRWFVVVSGEETKTGKSIDCPVPELLESYLATYLDLVRPEMQPHPTCAALWLHPRGGALAYAAIGDIIARHLTSHFGFRVTLHDVRDAAITLWAISAPDQIGVARDLLAHSDLRTTTRHYNRAKGIEASRVYRNVIAAMRKKQNRRGR